MHDVTWWNGLHYEPIAVKWDTYWDTLCSWEKDDVWNGPIKYIKQEREMEVTIVPEQNSWTPYKIQIKIESILDEAEIRNMLHENRVPNHLILALKRALRVE